MCKSFDVTHISSTHKLYDLKGRRLIIPHPVRNTDMEKFECITLVTEYPYTEGPYNQRTKHDV